MRDGLEPKKPMNTWLVIILAVIGVTPGIIGAISAFMNTAEEKAVVANEKAETGYERLKEQVEYTDMRLRAMEEDIQEARRMIFDLSVAYSKIDSPPRRGPASNVDKIKKQLKKEEILRSPISEKSALLAEQRPMLPQGL